MGKNSNYKKEKLLEKEESEEIQDWPLVTTLNDTKDLSCKILFDHTSFQMNS